MMKEGHNPSARGRFESVRYLATALCVSAVAATILWTSAGLSSVFYYWREMVTMIFGSFIAGATSEGGGAVAFPIFTKVLHISPQDSRTFTLGIQTFGMGAASAAILIKRIHVNWAVLSVTASTGAIGMILGALYIHTPPSRTRVLFTAAQAALGIFLAATFFMKDRYTRENSDPLEKLLLPFAGFAGGILSSIIGVGADVIVFSICVILCRYSPKRITPTTILLQWFLSVIGIAMHLIVMSDVSDTTRGRLAACIPIVLLFGPVGVLITNRVLSDATLTMLVGVLIISEVISTILIVPLQGAMELPIVMLISALALSYLGHRRGERRLAHAPAIVPVDSD